MSARPAIDLSVYLVTDAALCGERGVASVVAAAVSGGVGVVQVRDKSAEPAALLATIATVADAVDGRAMLLVNDRVDVAIEARRRGIRLDGVHLGQGDDSVTSARDALGDDVVVGLTAHDDAHLAALEARGERAAVDYLGVGVIRATATKPDHPPVLGLAGFARFTARAARDGLPCVAIGGVGLSDVAAVRAAGGAGIAVVSAICSAPDPRAAARAFTRAWGGR